MPPRLILGVPERILADGRPAQPLDEEACREAARRLRSLGVEAVAIVFIYSYANPAHERRAAAIVAEEFPHAAISISSNVLPEFREYERSMATALNAYVQPLVADYVDRIAAGLNKRGIAAPLLIMKSNGGVVGPAQASRHAIQMALSGPAAGAIGAAFVARLAGCDNAISIDIGGTSADVSLIRDGNPARTTEGEYGPFPLALPIIDIHSIGAGGGSIARVTDTEVLQSVHRARGPTPAPPATGAAAPKRPSPMPMSCLAGCRRRCSQATCGSTLKRLVPRLSANWRSARDCRRAGGRRNYSHRKCQHDGSAEGRLDRARL